MRATPGAFLRAGGLVLLAVILQISGFGPMRFFGGYPDLMPLVVAGTPEMAMYGFAVFYALCLVLNWWFYLRADAYVKNP